LRPGAGHRLSAQADPAKHVARCQAPRNNFAHGRRFDTGPAPTTHSAGVTHSVVSSGCPRSPAWTLVERGDAVWNRRTPCLAPCWSDRDSLGPREPSTRPGRYWRPSGCRDVLLGGRSAVAHQATAYAVESRNGVGPPEPPESRGQCPN